MLGTITAVATPGLVARVVTLLQDELLSLELRVLITHPAENERCREGDIRVKDDREIKRQMAMVNKIIKIP